MSAPAIAWVRSPRQADFLSGKGLTPGEKYLWEQANRCIELGQEIIIPRFARMCEVSDQLARKAFAKFAELGLLVAEPRPGKSTIYSLPHTYLTKANSVENSETVSDTPQQNVRGTPQQNVRGHVGAYKERARHAFCIEKDLEKPIPPQNEKQKPKPPTTEPQSVTPETETDKLELISQLQQRGVETRPYRFILTYATCRQLQQTINRGDRTARGPGLYVTILREILGIPTKPPGAAKNRRESTWKAAGAVLQRMGFSG